MQILKVMLIDDEYMALEYLRELIPWEKYGFKIAAESTDAVKVMETFKKAKPQIVISDIKMPGIDGIDLCRQMLNIDKSVKIILLTAYSDFEYAKQAISMGVSGYILKHEIDEQRLIQELSKLRETIEKENDKNKIINKYVIMNTIGESCKEDSMGNKQWESLESSNGTFAMLLLKEDSPYSFEIEHQKEQDNLNLEKVNKYLYNGEENGYTYIDCFSLRNGITAFLYSSSRYFSGEDFKNTFSSVAVRNRKTVSEKTGKSYSAVYSMGMQKLDSISLMYHSSVKIFSQLVFIGTGKTVYSADVIIPTDNSETVRNCDNIIAGIRGSLAELNIVKAIHQTAVLYDDIILKTQSFELLKHCTESMVSLLSEWRTKCFLPEFKNRGENRCYTVQQIRDFLIFQLSQSIQGLDPNVSIYSKKVYDAVEFLHRNYSRDISVATVADALEISESNLSKSFKKETGKSVLDYLTDVRITAAKNLLSNTNYKIYQISDMVGYKTSQYFSQVFLKATGIHPVQFRDTALNNSVKS